MNEMIFCLRYFSLKASLSKSINSAMIGINS